MKTKDNKRQARTELSRGEIEKLKKKTKKKQDEAYIRK